MKTPIKISVVINFHSRDSLLYLKKNIKSCRNFADEIIIINMSSLDLAEELPKNDLIRFYSHKALDYVEPARNFGIKKSQGQWLMLLDPDEYLTKALKTELKKLSQRKDIDFVRIPRKNIIFGRWIRHSRFWPDYLIRFFRKGKIIWPKKIHAQPVLTDHGFTLLDSESLAIRHQHYRNIRQYLTRSLRYSEIQAEELIASGYLLKISDLVQKPTEEFLSRFFVGEGYKDGIHGLILAVLQGFTTFLSLIYIWEKEGQKEKPLAKETFVRAISQSQNDFRFWYLSYLKNEFYKNFIWQIILKIKIFFVRWGKTHQ